MKLRQRTRASYRRRVTLIVMCVLMSLRIVAAEPAATSQALFDGSTLAGWQAADPSYWSVEDGAIVGRITPEHPCGTNQYLVWSGGELADFELALESRLRGEGGINNGFQFRSRLLPDGDICGYQVDNNLQTDWKVRLYDEYGRHTLAMRGTRTFFAPDGAARSEPIPAAAEQAWFDLEDWHRYRLVCDGPRISLYVDDKLAAEVIDKDVRRAEHQGVLALQLHSGPPTEVRFRAIQLRTLRPAAESDPAQRSPKRDEPLESLRATAFAWWRLDDGGHGAQPPLRHFPAWEQFEMNVRPTGAGAPSHPILLMQGAHFETEAAEPLAGPFTIHVRARADEISTHATLLHQPADDGSQRLHFGIVPAADKQTLQLTVNGTTAAGAFAVHTPLPDDTTTTWHDIALTYDGHAVTIFLDGNQLGSCALPGPFVPSRQPVWLAAAPNSDQNHADPFLGELAEFAIWPRVLSKQELTILCSPRD